MPVLTNKVGLASDIVCVFPILQILNNLLTGLLASELKPAEIGNAYFQNQSCDPFTPASRPCLLGNYAAYSINVSNVDDVRAGIRFAEEKNIRLVIKSTGHE